MAGKIECPITRTEFGFERGALTVERRFSFLGSVCTRLRSKKHDIELHTRKGGKMRLFVYPKTGDVYEVDLTKPMEQP